MNVVIAWTLAYVAVIIVLSTALPPFTFLGATPSLTSYHSLGDFSRPYVLALIALIVVPYPTWHHHALSDKAQPQWGLDEIVRESSCYRHDTRGT